MVYFFEYPLPLEIFFEQDQYLYPQLSSLALQLAGPAGFLPLHSFLRPLRLVLLLGLLKLVLLLGSLKLVLLLGSLKLVLLLGLLKLVLLLGSLKLVLLLGSLKLVLQHLEHSLHQDLFSWQEHFFLFQLLHLFFLFLPFVPLFSHRHLSP